MLMLSGAYFISVLKQTSLSYFTKEVKPHLAKLPSKYDGFLANTVSIS